MRFWVGITDYDWYRYLAARGPGEEVNFWQPSAHRRPVRLEVGAPFLFKLHAPRGGHIVGGGYFAHYTPLPASIAWDYFGDANGAPTLSDMKARIERYRRSPIDVHADQVGCTVLVQPFFFAERAWIAPPRDFAPNVVQGRTYESDLGEGRLLWERVQVALAGAVAPRAAGAAAGQTVSEDAARYGTPVLVAPRLGQGAFRTEVLDAYERRCAVTAERTLPALSAAHIKPYGVSGPHQIANGLLLRADVHVLFDRGYVTVTPDLHLRVSRRIKEEFENGRDYYALDRREIRVPAPPFPRPGREYLEWHADEVFRG